MRLNSKEIETLKRSLKDLDKDARIYLFGSRADDKKKGGDIDLLIISQKLDKKSIRSLKHKFFENFGEQKLDIIIDDGKLKDPFAKKVYQEAVVL
jgi:predicted nucleotidyltransferase